MPKLSGQDKRHLDAAEGWLGLGNWREANEELESASAAVRSRPAFLDARFRVYEAAGNWQLAAEVAGALCKLKPNDPQPCIYLARALNGNGSTRYALNFLIEAAKHFPKSHALAYDLARYCCQLGDLDTARAWLERAITIAGTAAVKMRALDDPLLQPLWMNIAKS